MARGKNRHEVLKIREHEVKNREGKPEASDLCVLPHSSQISRGEAPSRVLLVVRSIGKVLGAGAKPGDWWLLFHKRINSNAVGLDKFNIW